MGFADLANVEPMKKASSAFLFLMRGRWRQRLYSKRLRPFNCLFDRGSLSFFARRCSHWVFWFPTLAKLV